MMTLEPPPSKDLSAYPDPAQCAIHASSLEEIKGIVVDVRTQIIELKSMSGPLVEHEKELEDVRGNSTRAHERIDTLKICVDDARDDIEDIQKAQTKLLIKIGVIFTPVSAAIGGLIGAIVAHIK